MIAAHQIAFGWSAKGLSAKDYIQDGLVAMWDGIENADWGVHDPDSTTWNDLVSGTPFAVSGKGDFTADAFHLTERIIGTLGTKAMKTAIDTSVFTAEIVNLSSNFNVSIFMWGNPKAFTFTTLSDYAVRFYSGGTIISQTASGMGQSTGVYGIARNGLQAKAYFRGVQLGAETTCAAIGSTTAGMDIPVNYAINSIRIYSRALTAEEIAHNYEIDKARFGL